MLHSNQPSEEQPHEIDLEERRNQRQYEDRKLEKLKEQLRELQQLVRAS